MLELHCVTKKFQVYPAVNNVSFSIKPGEILGYLGPNGAGKSTTIKILAGLLNPTEREILYNGKNIKKIIYEYKQKIGYVPENSEIYPHLSAFDYLMMVGRLRKIPKKKLKTKIIELMRLFNLSIEMEMEIASYSKGMIQKVLISSAIMHNPEILLLDEPLNGLDVTTALVIRDLIKKLSEKGKIIIYSSHILEIVEKICRRVIILHKGSIVADDTVSKLRNLMKLPSLEQIFDQLIVEEDTEAIASEINDIIRL